MLSQQPRDHILAIISASDLESFRALYACAHYTNPVGPTPRALQAAFELQRAASFLNFFVNYPLIGLDLHTPTYLEKIRHYHQHFELKLFTSNVDEPPTRCQHIAKAERHAIFVVEKAGQFYLAPPFAANTNYIDFHLYQQDYQEQQQLSDLTKEEITLLRQRPSYLSEVRTGSITSTELRQRLAERLEPDLVNWDTSRRYQLMLGFFARIQEALQARHPTLTSLSENQDVQEDFDLTLAWGRAICAGQRPFPHSFSRRGELMTLPSLMLNYYQKQMRRLFLVYKERQTALPPLEQPLEAQRQLVIPPKPMIDVHLEQIACMKQRPHPKYDFSYSIKMILIYAPILAKELRKANDQSGLESLEYALKYARLVLEDPKNENAVAALTSFLVNNDALNSQAFWMQFFATLILLAGLVLVGLGLLAVPVSGLSLTASYIGGSILSAGGASLFYAGSQKAGIVCSESSSFHLLMQQRDKHLMMSPFGRRGLDL